jgi:DNA-binding transcriptional ArsR family regulator
MPTIAHPTLANVPLTAIVQALGDPIRLNIVRTVLANPGSTCGELCDQTSKSLLSHHIKVLREAGILRMEPEGVRRRLTIRAEELEERAPGLLDAVLNAGEPI